MAINEEAWNDIIILMNNSFWGRNSSFDTLIRDLKNEVNEFINAIENNDTINSIEEIADVMMISLCILYKMSSSKNQNPIDKIMEAIDDKLKRRFHHLFEGEMQVEGKAEQEIWHNAKNIENIINYMFCDNITCQFCGMIGRNNIIIKNKKYICKECGKEIKKSKKSTLFYNRKNRRKYIDQISNAILEYAKGNYASPEIFELDNNYVFGLFCEDILKSQLTIRNYFINYICEKYKLEKKVVDSFCNISLQIYDKKVEEKVDLLSKYCTEVSEGNFEYLNSLTNRENIKMKNKLRDVKMDVEKRIEKVIKYNARSWNNQLVHKYLLKYNKGGKNRILECMTIIHYQNERINDLTIELSNMYNCVVGCRFCASSALPETICFLDGLDYVRQLNTCLTESGINPDEFENFYVSFAGIGEPSVAYKSIADAMVIIRDMFPQVKFNIATFGFNMKCFDYWRVMELPIRTLQIPFYSSEIETLKYIVENLPSAYDFQSVVKNALSYKNSKKECRVKINYLVMKDINDTPQELENLCKYLEEFKNDIVIKVSYLNYTKPGEENNFYSPGIEKLDKIKKKLDKQGFNCYIFGTEINTELGCGQLAQNHISFK